MPPSAQEHRAHTEQARRNDVVIDAVAHHDALLGRNAEVLAGAQEEPHIRLPVAVVAAHFAVRKELTEPQAVQFGNDRDGLVRRQPQQQAVPNQPFEHFTRALA